MSNVRTSPGDVKVVRALLSQRFHLTIQLIRRDFRARFAGSALGVTWAILQPLSMVALYWFVFTRMIGGRVAAEEHYVSFLISGLLPWIGINEGIARGTTSIVENAAVVKRLPFRSEILVLVPNASALIFEGIALTLFVLLLAFDGRSLTGLWLLPVALTIQFLLQLGIGWLLAATYVFFRDVTQVLGFALSIVFYLSPILYRIVESFKFVFRWNPLTPLLGLFRSAMLAEPLPDAGSIVFLVSVTTLAFSGGLLFFRRAQPTLVDLI